MCICLLLSQLSSPHYVCLVTSDRQWNIYTFIVAIIYSRVLYVSRRHGDATRHYHCSNTKIIKRDLTLQNTLRLVQAWLS